jgi:hypothetical protein
VLAPSAQVRLPAGTPERRLDLDPSLSSDPAVAVAGRHVFVVWEDYRGTPGWGDVYLRRSLDGGNTWLPAEQALETDSTVSATQPVVAAQGRHVFVAWRGGTLTASNVYCRASSDMGSTWSAPAIVDTGDAAREPRLAVSGVDGQFAVLTWEDWRAAATHPYVYARRAVAALPNLMLDNEVRLDPPGSVSSENPEIAASDPHVHVAWTESHVTHVMRSPDSGLTWTDRQVIGVGSDYLPKISTSRPPGQGGRYVYVTWFRAGVREIHLNASSDWGSTWGGPQRLDMPPGGVGGGTYPEIASNVRQVVVVWTDARDTLGDIYLRRSSNAGASWSGEEVLDVPDLSPTGESYSPQVSVLPYTAFNSMIDVTWEEGSHGQRDVYLARILGTTTLRTRIDQTLGSASFDSTGARVARTRHGTSPGAVVVWMDNRSAPGVPRDIYGRLVVP